MLIYSLKKELLLTHDPRILIFQSLLWKAFQTVYFSEWYCLHTEDTQEVGELAFWSTSHIQIRWTPE